MDLVADDETAFAEAPQRGQAGALHEVNGFGSDPGNLRMFVYEPGTRARRCPCVLVLHGCLQTAAGYDAGSGWSRLAEEHGFLLVYAEQQKRNNDNACFSWFQTGDVRRGGGEAESISQMVGTVVTDWNVDPNRVFVCGLSAGGAMAGAMLATYPELFAGGAIIAGLPYGAASTPSEAFDAMFVGRVKPASKWGDLVRAATSHSGRWPKVSVWYGTDDQVVKPINGGELVKQWTNVHGVGAEQPKEDRVGPATRQIWHDSEGRDCVTLYMVPGLGHGAPTDGEDPPTPFFLPAGLSSTRCIAEDFGLTGRKTNRLLSLLGL